jgi:hypothetical protein
MQMVLIIILVCIAVLVIYLKFHGEQMVSSTTTEPLTTTTTIIQPSTTTTIIIQPSTTTTTTIQPTATTTTTVQPTATTTTTVRSSSPPVLTTASNINGNLNTNVTYTGKNTTSTPERQHKWLAVFNNADLYANDTGQVPEGSTQQDAQIATPLPDLLVLADRIYGKTYGPYFFPSANHTVVSGWVQTGSSNQCVGVISSADNGYFIVSAYGLTSTAPTALVNGVSTVSVTPTNQQSVQDWIIANCPANTTVPFMYDYSVGTNGQITWLSFV